MITESYSLIFTLVTTSFHLSDSESLKSFLFVIATESDGMGLLNHLNGLEKRLKVIQLFLLVITCKRSSQ